MFVFFAAPILLAVWWAGKRSGYFTALLSALVWWYANQGSHPYSTQIGYAWATANRWVFFVVVCWSGHAVRKKQQGDAEQIRQLEERRQLEEDIVAVSEHEQQRIGQDLHDGLCQQLAAISCAQHILASDLRAQSNPAAQDAAMIEEAIQHAMIEARTLARGIFPIQVGATGLVVALNDLAQMTQRLTGAEISVSGADNSCSLEPEVTMHLYRIAQEAVSNALRHGRATAVLISTRMEAGVFMLLVEDNGCGFDAVRKNAEDGMGLRTMRYRAQSLQAQIEVGTRPHSGSFVCVKLDLNKDVH
jgi:signal transduction histidine kinase